MYDFSVKRNDILKALAKTSYEGSGCQCKEAKRVREIFETTPVPETEFIHKPEDDRKEKVEKKKESAKEVKKQNMYAMLRQIQGNCGQGPRKGNSNDRFSVRSPLEEHDSDNVDEEDEY